MSLLGLRETKKWLKGYHFVYGSPGAYFVSLIKCF